MRHALDGLPDPMLNGSVTERLRAAGMIVELPRSDNIPTRAELQALEQAHSEWLATRVKPLGLAEAVIAERDEADDM